MNTGLLVEPVTDPHFLSWKNDIVEPETLHLDDFFKKYAPSIDDEEAAAYAAPSLMSLIKRALESFPKLSQTQIRHVLKSQAKHSHFGKRIGMGKVSWPLV